MNEKKLFIFVVFTFNHSKYILEHLESIKFLIESYGIDFDFKLVLGDDGSRDNTLDLVRYWTEKNKILFKEIVIQGDGINRGTCANFTDLWKYINSEFYKVTAGDDVYSHINLFKETNELEKSDFVSGIPLILQEGQIFKSNSTILHMMATDLIYRNRNFMDRMTHISVINTPSLMYRRKFVQNEKIFKFIREFKVTEDFPMMVGVAKEYPETTFKQSKNVLVYYRRTSGSTYLVRGSDFENDKVKVFRHLINNEKSWMGRILLKNRLWCFLTDNKFKRRCLNLNYLVYVFNLVPNIFALVKMYREVNINVESHIKHYAVIKQRSDEMALKFIDYSK
jgi:hypothetical protein